MSASHGSNRPFQFNYVPYPLWRRKLPLNANQLLDPFWARYYPVQADRRPVPTLNDLIDTLQRFDLLDMTTPELREQLSIAPAAFVNLDLDKQPALADGPVRVPAQWEPTERVMLSWPVNFPPLWPMHAAMVAAIAPVADVQINVSHMLWARAIELYMARHHSAVDMSRVTFYHLPTDDIWIRDYGPIVGLDANGERVAVSMIYDPLPNYPQERDNLMPQRWAAHEGMALRPMDFHGEGGNLWADDAGTLLMTNQAYRLNPDLTRDTLHEHLHAAFDFEKLILIPRLRVEETGHIDLLVKLADRRTLLMSTPRNALFTGDRLRAARQQLARETNARGERYRIVELPTPPLYANWFGYPIRRSYTNALTVNGRVLVPVYGIPTDEKALRVYAETMPDHTIVPIDSAAGANGGGAVHCMTKEVPQAQA